MIEIDGSEGEGGGQIFRSSIALSMITGRSVRVRSIRGGRKKPGLMRQHLTALDAAQRICGARVDGAAVRSTEVVFEPGTPQAGTYHFAVGTAGSTTLVLQAVLPALLIADGPSEVVLEGGTHNPWAPPFDFLARAFLPLIERMGPRIEATLEQPGFFPAGGGRLRVRIEPTPTLAPIELIDAGAIRAQRARVLTANLPAHIGRREVQLLSKQTSWSDDAIQLEDVEAHGPGNVVLLEIERDTVTEVFTGFGQRGVRAEAVVSNTVKAMRRYLEADVPVGEHLADQLLLPMAMAGGGSMRTLPLSRHASTQVDLLGRFVEVPIRVERRTKRRCEVHIGR
ncbi:MAG: RNA 3'-terminal phosphate cyclase [Acidobacteriota bacterium]